MSGECRWEATVNYLSSEHGEIDVTYDLLELDELWEYVEDGPDDRTINTIVIQRVKVDEPSVFVEDAST